MKFKKIYILLIWIFFYTPIFSNVHPNKNCYMRKYKNIWTWYNPNNNCYIVKYKNKYVWYNPKTNTILI